MSFAVDKYCNGCDSIKSRTDFYKRSGSPGKKGYVMSLCKICHGKKTRNLNYMGRHPERAKRYTQKRQQLYPEIFAELSSRRHAARLKRTPKWVNIQALKEIYAEAKRKTGETGVLHHVDHIIPLQGDNVSGLHVAENLRVIPAQQNWYKHNFFAG